MHTEFAIEPQRLVAALGPAIGPCCFVVADEVAKSLASAYPDALAQAFVAHRDGHRQHVDLWLLNQHDLSQAGLDATAVATVRRCTACSNDLFSYRRQQGQCGRQAGVIALSGAGGHA